MTALPPLVLAAHGSPHPAHRPAIQALCDAVGRKGDTVIGWLDHHQPDLVGAVAAARQRGAAGRRSPVVVVPLLLTAGFHARVDVPGMLQGVRNVQISEPLGPDVLLAEAMIRRLDEAGTAPLAPVVLAAAGSSDPDAVAQVELVAGYLAERRPGPVSTGFLSGSGRPLDEAVALAVTEDPFATVAPYLIAPGTLAQRISEQARAAGAIRVAAPLGAAPEMVELVRARWLEGSAKQ